MPGMTSGLDVSNPILIAAFRAALLHQGLIALVILAVLALAWVSVREWIPAVRSAAGASGSARMPGGSARMPGREAEPAGRRLLRIGFGITWIFDGLLQAQPAMAAGLPSKVIEPAAASSPGWVQHAVNWAGTTWSFHPIQAGAAAVWIQVGIGAALIAAPAGRPARLAALASAGWGLVVWVFGEAFGGIFAPGQTFLFGAPGAAAFYCAAGLLVALPDRHWRTPQLGRRMLGCLGLFLIGMAVLQAWPGRGFWQGTVAGRPGAVASMARSMSGTPQPAVLAGWVAGFGSFAAAHGWAVNLVAVTVLAVTGAALLSGRPRLARPAVILMIAFCLADWVLVGDLGFLGGLGTDPGSMIPVALLGASGYLALAAVPAAARAPTVAEAAGTTQPAAVAEPAGPAQPAATPQPAATQPAATARWQARGRAAGLARAFGMASLSTVLALWAAVVVLIGAAPMAMAQASPNADPIIARAIDGDSAPLNFAAPAFTLTDQDGRQVSLASLRGKVVLLTFLDPVCTSDCPLIAQELRAADRMLGARSGDVELVAIVANPLYRTVAYTRAFDLQEHLGSVPNWLFLTGSLARLHQAWRQYDIAAQVLPAGGMIAHSDVAYVIDASGHTRTELDIDPGPGTATTESSFAVELCDAAEQVMRSS